MTYLYGTGYFVVKSLFTDIMCQRHIPYQVISDD